MSDDYDNKQLSGAGVVYKFLQALDEELWCDFSDDFLDLVALGNISDVMDMKSFETKYLVDKGLNQINNKFFNALIKAQEYSMKNCVNIHNVQWYCTPIVNACIRVGTEEERELMFRAFIEQDESFEYKKRATKTTPAVTIQENIYDRAVRLAKNAKSRQDKLRDKYTDAIVEEVEKLESFKLNNNCADKVTMIDASNLVEHSGLTGLVAIRVAEKFNRPCLLFKKHIKDGKIVFGGSARNIDNSPVESLKDIVNNNGIFSGKGHPNAFGLIGLPVEKFDEAKDKMNELLKDIEYDATYYVDYILDFWGIDPELPIEMSKLENFIGQGLPEPQIAVEGVELKRSDISVFGKTSNTLKFSLPNGVEFVQFFCKPGNELYDWFNEAWDEEEQIVFNLIGSPKVNEFMGVRTPQIVINDIEIIRQKYTAEDLEEDIW